MADRPQKYGPSLSRPGFDAATRGSSSSCEIEHATLSEAGSSQLEIEVAKFGGSAGTQDKPAVCQDCGSVSWLTFLTFRWIEPMLLAGRERQVSLADAPPLSHRDDTLRNTHRLLQKLGEVERAGLSHPLLRAMVLAFWPEYLAQKLISVAEIFMRLADPLLLQRVLVWQEAMNDDKSLSQQQVRSGITAVVLLILLGVFKIFWQTQKQLYDKRVAVRQESALRGTVLARCVQARPTAAADAQASRADAGKGGTKTASPAVYNLISYDVGPNVAIIGVAIGLWSFPIGFSATLILLFDKVHDAVIPGLAVGLLIKAIVFVLKTKDGLLRQRLMEARDDRILACTEGFNGIRVLQMLAWTGPFYDRIMLARSRELKVQRTKLWLAHMVAALDYSTGTLTTLATLAWFVTHSDAEIKASTWLPVTALIGNLVGPFGNFPNWMNTYLVWRNAYGRVNTYMGYEAKPPVLGRSCFTPLFILLLLLSGVITGLARVVGFVEVGVIWSASWGLIWCFLGCGLILAMSRYSGRRAAKAKAAGDDRAEDNTPRDGGPIAELRRCTASWLDCREVALGNLAGGVDPMGCFQLRAVTLLADAGALTVLTGGAAQGKTSVLAALLGEMFVTSGTVASPAIERRRREIADSSTSSDLLPPTSAEVRELLGGELRSGTLAPSATGERSGAVPYAAQETMVFSGSVRWNILFGAPYDAPLYARVVKACALEADFDAMPGGDQAVVAQGGTTLSGGQRARLGLARAVYRAALELQEDPCGPPPLVLLDDPMSALDHKVAQHICLSLFSRPNGVLCRCAVLLAAADAWWMEDLAACRGGFGGVGQLQVLQVEAGCLIDRLGSAAAHAPLAMETSAASEVALASQLDGIQEAASVHAQSGKDFYNVDDNENQELDDDPPPAALEVIGEEHREAGAVRRQTYLYYVRAVGPVLLGFLLYALFNIMVWQLATSMWLAYWADAKKPGKMRSLVLLFTDDPPTSKDVLLRIYAIFVALFTVSNFAGHAFEVVGGVRASRSIFKQALRGAFSMPLRWWDQNPTGRVLNRFSEDVEIMDNAITFIMGIIFGAALYFVYHVVMLGFTNPISLSILPLIILGMEYYARFYRRTIREVQRIMLTCMSVVYQDMVEAVLGSGTVVAFANTRQVLCHCLEGLDRLQRIVFALETINLWLGFRMALIGYTMAIYAKLYPVFQYFGVFSPQSAALVGFSIHYAQETSGIVQQFIKNFSELEMQLISIERLREYADVRQEVEGPSPQPPPGDHPRLRFADVSVTYRAGLPPALQDVRLDFYAREAVAVVGRTGAGKSSLLLAVLQLVPYSGSIEVDGLPLCLVSPAQVRRRVVGVVPQQPVLFTGTLRWNLDPEGWWTDEELWAAIDAVGLRQVAAFESLGLEAPLASARDDPAGEAVAVSLSQGQQQLLCAARVLLRQQRVVLLDEVTSTLPQATALATVTDMVARFRAQDATVLLVTHQAEVTACCGRVVTIAGGRVVDDQLLQEADQRVEW